MCSISHWILSFIYLTFLVAVYEQSDQEETLMHFSKWQWHWKREWQRDINWHLLYAMSITIALLKLATVTAETATVKSQDKKLLEANQQCHTLGYEPSQS